MDRPPLKISSERHLKTLSRMALGTGKDRGINATLSHSGFKVLAQNAGIKRNRLLSARSEHAQVTSVRAKEDYKKLQRAFKAMPPEERRRLGLRGDFKDIHERTAEQIYKRAGIAKETLLKSEAEERRRRKTEQIMGKPEDRLGHVKPDSDQRLPGRIVPVRTKEAAIERIRDLQSRPDPRGKSVLADQSLHSSSDIPVKTDESNQDRKPQTDNIKSRWMKEEAEPTSENQSRSEENTKNLDSGLPF